MSQEKSEISFGARFAAKGPSAICELRGAIKVFLISVSFAVVLSLERMHSRWSRRQCTFSDEI